MGFFVQGYVTLSIVAAFLITFFVSPFVITKCKKIFKSKKQAAGKKKVPTGGGIIFIPVMVFFFIFFVFKDFSEFYISIFLILMILGSIVIAVLGALYDKKGLRLRTRLIVQTVAVVIPVCFLPDIFLDVNDYLEKMMFVLVWLGFVNVYSLSDRIEGNVVLQSIAIGIVGAFLVPAISVLFLIIIASLIGFLRVNSPSSKCKVLIGSIGSSFLGYILMGLMFVSLVVDISVVWSFITITILLTADILYTLLKRIIRKEKPLRGDYKDFWIDRMQTLKFSYNKILALGAFANIALIIIVVLTYDNAGRFISPVLGAIVFACYAGYVYYYENKKRNQTVRD